MTEHRLTTLPEPPYYAVIFTSVLSDDTAGYEPVAERMMALAAQQPGFLGVESAREQVGITVSYWQDEASIRQWQTHAEHQLAQKLGKERWYATFALQVARVERSYCFP